MAEIRNSPRNGLALLAENLKSGKQYLNQYEIAKWMPLIGGSGLGDIFMGQSPELVDDASYYGLNALLKGGNRATGGIGTLAPDNRTFDAAMLGLDLAGLTAGTSKLAGKGINKGLNKLFTGNTNQSRREFLKNSAALGGASALGLTSLNIVDNILKEAGEQVAKKASDNVAKETVEQTAKKYRFNSLKEYNDYLNNIELKAIKDNQGPGMKEFFAKNDEAEYYRAKELNKIPEDTYTNPYITREAINRTLNEFSPEAKAEMKNFKKDFKEYQENIYWEEQKVDGRHWSEVLDDYINYYKNIYTLDN